MTRTVLTLAALTLATPALAGNIAPAPLEPAPVFVEPAAPLYNWGGGYIGGQVSYADIDTSGDVDTDGDGALYGLRAGYDYDFGRAILGGLVQYDFGEIELDDTDVEVEDVLRLGVRGGFHSGANLFYATGGYAEADTNDLGKAEGYFAGLGYERFVTENVTIGAEALYHEFDDFDDTDADIDADATTVGLNINYRF
ncbi:porin family protein [Jannaschia sp. S6380]|uniref:outer membrane protein n=1 Tax=Jannaschia sp. S6380 TaxID=2926408 RepID=UPI001FF3B123|nr:outer membrane beta-barrel protein [Jannaschia sp. S6380]MCK0167035.1 porin family protein [Jannaschia sp. S6380]